MMTRFDRRSDCVLETKNLCIGFGEGKTKNIVLENLNVQLYPGELVCFMGTNGIGKSTLIRTLAGIQKPITGTVLYSGSKTLTQQIAVVLTDKITATNLSVYEVITFGRYPYLDWTVSLTVDDTEIIESVIDQVNIRHLADKRLYELSDGQLQLVMIARAMAQNGDIILLDEPTAHLDLNNRVEIMSLLRNLCRTLNKSIVVAMHELDLALQMADVIWLASSKKDFICGIPEDLVLDGSFDDAFRFKGFDLRTGKVRHDAHRDTQVSVLGSGPELLWTRNALERVGFNVDEGAALVISVKNENHILSWEVFENEHRSSFSSIAALLQGLS